MLAAMNTMQNKIEKHQVIDHVEDNVDELLTRLEGQLGGKGVKILTEEEEQQEQEQK